MLFDASTALMITVSIGTIGAIFAFVLAAGR